MDKLEALKKLEEEIISNDSLPLKESNLVFGEGDHNCQVMFIGEAPGFHENKLGRPFVGRAGQLLDTLMKNIGWQRSDVYITNIVKRRPPENRDPLPEEIEAYKPYLAKQIEIINPKVVATLGRFSMNYFLPSAKISLDQGKLFKCLKHSNDESKDYIFIVPLLHPAAALRSTKMLGTLETNFKKLPAIIIKIDELLKTEKVKEISPKIAQNKPTKSLF